MYEFSGKVGWHDFTMSIYLTLVDLLNVYV